MTYRGRSLAGALVTGILASSGAAQAGKPTLVVDSGHSNTVNSLAFSPSENWIASAGSDSVIKLWDIASGRLMRNLAGHSKGVSAVAVSPDGKRLASVGEDDTAIIWDPETGAAVRTVQIREGNTQGRIQFSRDGQSILTISFDAIRRWNVVDGRLLQTIAKPGAFAFWHTFAMSPDERLIAVAHSGAQGAPLAGAAIGSQVKLLERASGKLVRVLGTHSRSESVSSLAFSPDGQLLASADSAKTIKLWQVTTGRLLHTIDQAGGVWNVAFSPDSRLLMSSGASDGVKLWDVSTGRVVSTIRAAAYSRDAIFSLGGSAVAAVGQTGVSLFDARNGVAVAWPSKAAGGVSVAGTWPDHWLVAPWFGLQAWNAASGQLALSYERKPGWIDPTQFAAVTSGRRYLVAGRSQDNAIRLWDMQSGQVTHRFEWGPAPKKCVAKKPYECNGEPYFRSAKISPDGRWVAAAFMQGSPDPTLKVWDLQTDRLLHNLPSMAQGQSTANSMVFSRDGRWLVTAGWEGLGDLVKSRIRLWDVEKGTPIRSFPPADGQDVLDVSPDGLWIVTTVFDPQTGAQTLALYESATGKLARKFDAAGINNKSYLAKVSPDGRLLAAGVYESQAINLWDMATGKLIRTLEGNPGSASSLDFSHDGSRLAVGNLNGTSAVWDVPSGSHLTLTSHDQSGEWMTMTPEGFFAASSPKGGARLSIVRGLQVYAIEQVYQALFNPDLLREKLAGDPNGEVRQAATALSLEKVLNSGQAPQVTLTSPNGADGSAEEVVNAEALVADQGGGIGRIEWRLNGITVGIANAEQGIDKERKISRRLSLEPGENTIEVVAYNGANLLASRAVRATVTYKGQADPAKPNLHVLAIGINDYNDAGWVPPGANDAMAFQKLGLAVRDASTFASELKKAAIGRYGDVRVTLALDGDATAEGLERIVERLAGQVQSRDTFVLFAAAHGISENGRFYLIPQDYQGGPGSLARSAIGQDRLQVWIANRLQAKKVLILLDTCESGALVSGSSRSRTNVLASEAAIGRLHEATGRPVLTAAAEGKPAFEGYEGHGVFTWALLDALRNGDRNSSGTIELSELVAHVQDQVPKISAKLNGRGRAAVAARGSADDRQSARFGSRGEDFVLVDRLQ